MRGGKFVAFFIDDKQNAERREFRRIKVSSPIEYKFLNSERFVNSVTCDISEGGISFIVDGPVPIGTHLYFRARFRNRPQAIYGIARIAWSAKIPYSQQYKVGLEFREIGSISKADIVTFIQENKTPCFSS